MADAVDPIEHSPRPTFAKPATYYAFVTLGSHSDVYLLDTGTSVATALQADLIADQLDRLITSDNRHNTRRAVAQLMRYHSAYASEKDGTLLPPLLEPHGTWFFLFATALVKWGGCNWLHAKRVYFVSGYVD